MALVSFGSVLSTARRLEEGVLPEVSPKRANSEAPSALAPPGTPLSLGGSRTDRGAAVTVAKELLHMAWQVSHRGDQAQPLGLGEDS